MLTNRDALEKSIDKAINGIQEKANTISLEESDCKVVLDKICNYTAQKLTIESKTILASIYTNLSQQTLKVDIFQNSKNASAFYSRDIRSELSKKFTFEVPKEINYKEAKDTIKALEVSGAIIIVGSVVSFNMKMIIPVAISVIIAGIMGFVISNKSSIGSKEKCSEVIDKYLIEVKRQMMVWIDDIVKYYDNCVEEVKKNL
ncbi:hypothetical protein [Oceanirhabdus seepicola]|uniref:Uncharacterized protein n=1 Tax=Oceanirhabdus seepicola TaxID=2828781 RepID=A0A9J6P735_9CLOT|nr:hypothetical protein [Oceanirhabdus seepicola]MCM1991320.1 hypothetical protein [Oceanirhabdus seepicola]